MWYAYPVMRNTCDAKTITTLALPGACGHLSVASVGAVMRRAGGVLEDGKMMKAYKTVKAVKELLITKEKVVNP